MSTLQAANDGEAQVGERVTVLDLTTAVVHDYRLTDEVKAAGAAEEIAADSALGAALLGRHVGDVVAVERDGRTVLLEVVEIDG
jgi:transcription elongation GreA/GreB family factor